MNISNDIIVNAVKKALEASNIKALQGVDVENLTKSISDSILKSVGESTDIKSIGAGLMKGLQSAINKKDS